MLLSPGSVGSDPFLCLPQGQGSPLADWSGPHRCSVVEMGVKSEIVSTPIFFLVQHSSPVEGTEGKVRFLSLPSSKSGH
jgi:hypothetical protein